MGAVNQISSRKVRVLGDATVKRLRGVFIEDKESKSFLRV